ncbi:hypothetical protein EGR_04505 [Echinococcus granulosus]|uniref:Kelch-like protein n=1 Tax=Echinococcus granulosus TaxID=6210 RepID=W6UQT6_ECHGR|nr:hypothetical protein EGR_04505 [Echinococcus granulosus]EUB60672.1 hypothetical protein EGR_04505 [Echinococcus granulosus]
MALATRDTIVVDVAMVWHTHSFVGIELVDMEITLRLLARGRQLRGGTPTHRRRHVSTFDESIIISESIVEAAINYAYTGSITISAANVTRIYLLAHNLGSDTIVKWCVDFLRTRWVKLFWELQPTVLRTSLDNVSEVWSVANVAPNRGLMELCVPLMTNHFEALCLQTISKWRDAGRSGCDMEERTKAFAMMVSKLNVNKLSPPCQTEYWKFVEKYSGMLAAGEQRERVNSLRDAHSTSSMPRACHGSSAVNIPAIRIVVVGGSHNYYSNYLLNSAQLLIEDPLDESRWRWIELNPMLEGRSRPGIAYFNGCVVVAGGQSGKLHITIECLPLTSIEQPTARWTRLHGVDKLFPIFTSLVTFNNRLIMLDGFFVPTL